MLSLSSSSYVPAATYHTDEAPVCGSLFVIAVLLPSYLRLSIFSHTHSIKCCEQFGCVELPGILWHAMWGRTDEKLALQPTPQRHQHTRRHHPPTPPRPRPTPPHHRPTLLHLQRPRSQRSRLLARKEELRSIVPHRHLQIRSTAPPRSRPTRSIAQLNCHLTRSTAPHKCLQIRLTAQPNSPQVRPIAPRKSHQARPTAPHRCLPSTRRKRRSEAVQALVLSLYHASARYDFCLFCLRL